MRVQTSCLPSSLSVSSTMGNGCRFEACKGNILTQPSAAAQRQSDVDLSFSLAPADVRQLGYKRHVARPAFASVTVIRQQHFGLGSQEVFSSRLPVLQQHHNEPARTSSCNRGCQTLSLLQQAQTAATQLSQQPAPASRHQQEVVHVHQQHSSSQEEQHVYLRQEQQGNNSVQACQDGLARIIAQLSQAKLLLAGAMAAVVSRTAMAPLERVKMDLLLKTSSRSAVQTAVWVYEREGFAGFWKGNGLNLLRTAPFKALNFFSFDVYSKMLTGMMSDSSTSARFIAGAMAGITATLVCFPLDVLRTRLMAPWGHKYGGPWRTLQGMVKYEGPGALYAGCVPAVIGMAPSGAVFYGVYDLLKHNHLEALHNSPAAVERQQQRSSGSNVQHQEQHDLPVLYTLLYGAIAGAAAETFLYPLEVIRRKMQLQSMAAGAAYLASNSAPNVLRQHGLKAAAGALAPVGAGAGAFGAAGVGGAAVARIAAACAAIMQADGVKGFYAGLLPNMLQVLPSAALSYGTYESMKQVLGVVA